MKHPAIFFQPYGPSESIHRFFQRCVLAVLLVLTGQLAQAQLYIMNSNATGNFQRYDFTPNTTTALTAITWPASGNAPVMVGVGNYIYATSANSSVMQRYDITAQTWTTLSGNTPAQAGTLATDGTNLYQLAGTSPTNNISVYNPTANSWSAVSAIGTGVFTTIWSGVGTLYYIQSNVFKRYDPVTSTVITPTNKPSAVLNNATSCADANKVYSLAGNAVYVYTIATNTWAASAETTAPTNVPNGFVSDGTYLYGKNAGTIYKYTIGSGTTGAAGWPSVTTTALAGGSFPKSALAGSYYAPAAPACAAPVVTATISQATCTGATANANATITLSAFDANAKKIDYTIGSAYTGTGFASAATLPASAPYTVVSTLANPTVNQPYTIRIFCDAVTYTDKTVILAPKQCQTADLSVTVSPATQTGNAGEFLTYVVTLTNGGPSTATNVVIDVPMPDPTASLLSATAAAGTYNSLTKEWTIPSLAVGSTSLTFTVKVN